MSEEPVSCADRYELFGRNSNSIALAELLLR